MRKHKWLGLLLALAMLLSVTGAAWASEDPEDVAEAVPAEPLPAADGEVTVSEYGIPVIENFEDLKTVIASESEDGMIYYRGAEDLVIPEDFTLPEEYWLLMNDGDDIGGLVIAEGARVTLYGNVYTNELTVYGELECHGKYDYESMTDRIAVYGHLDNHTYLQAQILAGVDKISNYSDSTLRILCPVETEEELFAAKDTKLGYNTILRIDTAADITIHADLDLPDGVFLYVPEGTSLTVPAGVTLKNRDGLGIDGTVIVQGRLENAEYINAFGTSAVLKLDGGSYGGKGWIYARSEDTADNLPGFDLTQFDSSEWGFERVMLSLPNDRRFSTLEGLLALTQETYGERTSANYTGEGELVLSQDITIPENLAVGIYNYGSGTFRVAEGVTVTVNGSLTDGSGSLYVDGTLINNGNVSTGSLYVTGELRNNGYLSTSFYDGSVVVGEDRVVMGYDGQWSQHLHAHSEADLIEFAGRAANAERGCFYSIDLEEDVTLTQDLILDCSLSFNASLTVAEGATLTCDKQLSLDDGHTLLVRGTLVSYANLYLYGVSYGDEQTTLQIDGSLENYKQISVSGGTDYYSDEYFSAILRLGSGGSYSGYGTIRVSPAVESELAHDLPGFDLEAFSTRTAWDGDQQVILLQLIGSTEPAGTPGELTWGRFVGNEEIEVVDGVVIQTGVYWQEMPGTFTWKNGTPGLNEVEVSVYRVGDPKPVFTHQIGYSELYKTIYGSNDALTEQEDLQSGTYYFTVMNKGDGTQYSDSEVATSDTWEYVMPNSRIEKPTGLIISGRDIRFEMPDDPYIRGVDIDIYYAKTENGEPNEVSGQGYGWYYEEGTYQEMEPVELGPAFEPEDEPGGEPVYPDPELEYDPSMEPEPGYEEPFVREGNTIRLKLGTDLFEQNGPGWYSFRVRLLSSDITVTRNSEWITSDPCYIEDVPRDIGEQLMDLWEESETLSAQEIRDQVQEMDRNDLRVSLTKDTANNGATAAIKALEETLGGGAGVAVTEDMRDTFDGSLVSVVGAALNTPLDDDAPITLVVDKPAREDIIPEAYNNAVAIRFSMDVENVENTHDLAVPVKITIPVPDGVNPSYLVILHYPVDGGAPEEVIWPHLFVRGGQQYASFVLTGFSDFVITEVKGDDEPPTVLDAVILLQSAVNGGSEPAVSVPRAAEVLASLKETG